MNDDGYTMTTKIKGRLVSELTPKSKTLKAKGKGSRKAPKGTVTFIPAKTEVNKVKVTHVITGTNKAGERLNDSKGFGSSWKDSVDIIPDYENKGGGLIGACLAPDKRAIAKAKRLARKAR